jgi:hypothetical protein
MHEVTELLRAISWPLTTLVIFLILRVELQRFAKNMADRIRSAGSITIGPRGFELKGLLKAVPVPAEIQARKVALIRSIRALADKTMLDKIADALNVPQSSDARAQKNDIILELNGRIEAKNDMDQLSITLRPIIGRDF